VVFEQVTDPTADPGPQTTGNGRHARKLRGAH
jgi:hypothetical protein